MINLLNKKEKFWTNDPCILITQFCKFNPFVISTLSSTLNAYTRFVIIVTLILFIITKSPYYIYLGIFLIVIIIIIYYILKNKNMDNYEDCKPFLPYFDLNEAVPCKPAVQDTKNRNVLRGNPLPFSKSLPEGELSIEELNKLNFQFTKFDGIGNKASWHFFTPRIYSLNDRDLFMKALAKGPDSGDTKRTLQSYTLGHPYHAGPQLKLNKGPYTCKPVTENK